MASSTTDLLTTNLTATSAVLPPSFQPALADPINTKFTAPLFIPQAIDVTRGGALQMEMRETQQWLGLVDAAGNKVLTTVWTYGQQGNPGSFTYPGPTLVANRDSKLNIRWDNQLPVRPGSPYPGGMQYDPSIHLANPTRRTIQQGYIPLVTHLHGGHTESASDGIPEAWYVQQQKEKGPKWKKGISTYDNDQQAGTLFYHDHALGLTRLNVYAGLAGFYLLRDANINQLFKDNVLPSGKYEVGLAIQDKTFTPDGQLFYPQYPKAPAAPEFFGDTILVNGRTWPKMSVDRGEYLFHFLNGSDSRPYELDLGDLGYKEFTLVGKDGALLPNAVAMDKITIYPGERYDAVIDFSRFNAGSQLILKNGMGSGATADVMRFDVTSITGQDASVTNGTGLKNNSSSPPPFAFNPSNPSATKIDNTRQLALFEGTDPNGIIAPFLGTVKDGSLMWDSPVTENIKLGTTEKWVIVNTTPDAHPVHLHLVNFQVLSRQEQGPNPGSPNWTITSKDMGMNYTGGQFSSISLPNAQYGDGLYDYERGAWQDTVVVQPGEVIEILAKFDRPGEYVWHCHILSHEDNEMMRPFIVS
jgi:spore coat protein A